MPKVNKRDNGTSGDTRHVKKTQMKRVCIKISRLIYRGISPSLRQVGISKLKGIIAIPNESVMPSSPRGSLPKVRFANRLIEYWEAIKAFWGV